MNDILASLPSAQVIERLEGAGIACARMNTMQEFVAHAQHVERGRWTSVGSPVGPLQMLLPPVGLHDVAPHMGPVPALGEHTAAILGELGIDVETMAEWRSRGIL